MLLTEQVAEAVRLAREQRPDLALEGPIRCDAAVDLPSRGIRSRAPIKPWYKSDTLEFL